MAEHLRENSLERYYRLYQAVIDAYILGLRDEMEAMPPLNANTRHQ